MQPYNGQVSIYTGEIAEDIAVYMRDSEQTNSAISVGVQLDRELTVVGAGDIWYRCCRLPAMRR